MFWSWFKFHGGILSVMETFAKIVNNFYYFGRRKARSKMFERVLSLPLTFADWIERPTKNLVQLMSLDAF